MALFPLMTAGRIAKRVATASTHELDRNIQLKLYVPSEKKGGNLRHNESTLCSLLRGQPNKNESSILSINGCNYTPLEQF